MLVLVSAEAGFCRASADYENNKGTFGKANATADCIAVHRVGEIRLSVTNVGAFGNGFQGGADCLTGEGTVSCEFPKFSGIDYLFAAAFWIGAIKGRDTLVSTGEDGWTFHREMHPDALGIGDLRHRSLIDPTNIEEYADAVSEDDILAVYTDTLTAGVPIDEITATPHQPLFVRINESSYAWSYDYAKDFVLFDYQVTNFGFETLEQVYMGIYVDGDVGYGAECVQNACYADDISGFVHAVPETTRSGCEYIDTVNIAWLAENDGDPQGTSWNDKSATSVTATRIVRTPSEKLEVSFNWWISNGSGPLDFGPREKSGVGRLKEPLRDFSTGGIGTPMGDRNKHYIMSNREFDYDQAYTANILPGDSLWLTPISSQAATFSDGYDTRYLLSFGPFKIDPGETLPLSFAYVAGENLHTDPTNGPMHLDNESGNYYPTKYYERLSFEDLSTNARWASWIYDNPGVDTDGDGFKGKFVECIVTFAVDTIVTGTDTTFDTLEFVADTTFISGDGVPDFQGAKPPSRPDIRVFPSDNQITIRFNGLLSETTPDEFLRVSGEDPLDFEGYRVYIARDERESSFQLVASFDIEDYNKFVLDPDPLSSNPWQLFDTPYTLEEVQALYGDPASPETFNPLRYNKNNPMTFGDSVFYFESQDYNVSDFGVETPIVKTYPDAPPPSTLNPREATPDELTEDGYLKYYEYEITLGDLLPTVRYWVSVTAFDYGSPASGLPSLETSRSLGAIDVFARSNSAAAKQFDLPIYVYPNPY